MRILLLLMGLLLFLYGCRDEYPYIHTEEPFVLLVYLAGDNDLSGEATQKLEAIRQGYNPEENSRVFIYLDSQTGLPCLMELKTGKGEAVVDTITTYPEHNSASADIFAGVIRDVTGLAPSNRNGLLVFSHASGWLPESALSNPAGVRSIGRDGSDEMELADFAAAIPDGLFEYIVFETCFMAGIEVAWALKDKADYLLVSSAEIVSPGFTDIYPDHLSLLFQGVAGLTAFGEAAFTHYNRQTGWQQSATFSLVSTREILSLAAFLSRISLPEEIPLSSIQPFDRYGRHLFFDLEDVYKTILVPDEEQIINLERLIAACVPWKRATPNFLSGHQGFRIRSHSGLTTYYPQNNFPGLNSAWYQTEWGQFLKEDKLLF